MEADPSGLAHCCQQGRLPDRRRQGPGLRLLDGAGLADGARQARPGLPAGSRLPSHRLPLHLPSDPFERQDLSSKLPDKLRELTERLSELRAGAYQTLNYTAGCDDCMTDDEVAATHHGFLAPSCRCAAAGLVV